MRIHLVTRRCTACVLALGSVAIAGPAFAAIAGEPVKGATYSGTIHKTPTAEPISVKVSKSGNKVSNFNLSNHFYPEYCQGGAFPTIDSVSAPISSKDTFKAKLPLESLMTGAPQGNVTVTGKFGSGGHESGKVTTNLAAPPWPKSCSGTSSYSTTG